MKIVVTGATGLVGRALLLHLASRGDRVTAWVRDLARARDELGPEVACVATGDDRGLAEAIAEADAVIHLAGAPIVGSRWTARRKRELIASRVATAAQVVAAIRLRDRPLPVLISASAVGFYGDRGDAPVHEDAPRGAGFAADLCGAWEDAALAATDVAYRIVRARIGIVLARGGGALAPLARLGRLGLGGPMAGGAQWVPWIHLDDVVRGLAHVLDHPTLDGAVNLVGPAPTRQRDLAAAIGRTLDRPARLPTPGFALRAALGEAASVLLASTRALPGVLATTGYRFGFPVLQDALDDLLRDGRDIAIRRIRRDERPASAYLERRRPRYVMVARTTIDRPVELVAAFFANPENLGPLTPPGLRFEFITPRPIEMAVGATIDYRIRLRGIPMRWRTVIEQWQPGVVFVDAQHRGPYASWWHEHHFHAEGDRTVMEDRVYYALPLGPLGWLAHRLFVRRMLRGIFSYRAQAVRWRFAPQVDVAGRRPLLHALHEPSLPPTTRRAPGG